jgi:hypothetical protein
LLQKAAGFGGHFACGWGNLDRNRHAAYIARQDDKNDDACCSNEPPPPPYSHGTGALSRLSRPRAAGFWPRHFFFLDVRAVGLGPVVL